MHTCGLLPHLRPAGQVFYVNLPPPTSAPQGWYQDPQQPGQMRWWDGVSWTEHTQLPSTATPSSHAAPAAGVHPVLSPDSGRTPASKYVAITLWSLAGYVATSIIWTNVADGYGITASLYLITFLNIPLVIPGYVAWMRYKSATSRPLSGLAIAKRAFAALSALMVSTFILSWIPVTTEPDFADFGFVSIFVFLPLSGVSLMITAALYMADDVRSSRKNKSS